MPSAGEHGGFHHARFKADHSLWSKILWTQVTCLSCLSKYPVYLRVTEFLLYAWHHPRPSYMLSVQSFQQPHIVIPILLQKRRLRDVSDLPELHS